MLEQDNFPKFKGWVDDDIRCSMVFYMEGPKDIRPEIDLWLLPKLQEKFPDATQVTVELCPLRYNTTVLTHYSMTSLDQIRRDIVSYIRKNALPYSIGFMCIKPYGRIQFNLRQLTLLEYVSR